MKAMQYAIRCALILIAIGAASFASEDVGWGDYFGPGTAFGKIYILKIPTKDVVKSPKWIDNENPPLSAKRAVQVASEAVGKMERDSKVWSDQWERNPPERLLLTTVGNKQWIWIVRFSWVPKTFILDGQAPELSIAVSMDGKAILPVLAKDQSGGPPPGSGDR